MSFRKRATPLRHAAPTPSTSPPAPAAPTSSSTPAQQQTPTPAPAPQPVPTGSPALDALLGRPPGVPRGTALLLLEGGATEYASAVVRIGAAAALARGECVHVVGVGPEWGRGIPGFAGAGAEGEKRREKEREGMKIAWRYERLGGGAGAGAGAGGKGAAAAAAPAFDLAKRLDPPPGAQLHYHALDGRPGADPFAPALRALAAALAAAPPLATHRILVPALLSPAAYPPHAARPAHVLAFLHALRALLRRHARAASATIALPLALHARPSATLAWAAHLCDAVLELAPFPHRLGRGRTVAGAAPGADAEPQGLLKVLKVAGAHERGMGGVRGLGLGEDWAFVLSRRRFEVVRYTLPVDDDGGEETPERGHGALPRKADMEF